MEKRIEESFNDLEGSLEAMSSLFAWRNLKIAEQRQGVPPSFQIYDPTETDLRIETGSFLEASSNLQIRMKRIPASKREPIQKRLSKLESEFRRILRTEKLKNP